MENKDLVVARGRARLGLDHSASGLELIVRQEKAAAADARFHSVSS
jgi:hypothetical protein